MTGGSGCLAKGLTSPMTSRHRPRTEDSAPSHSVVRCDPAPGRQMLVRRPAAHVGARLGQTGVGQAGANPHDSSPRHPSQAKQVSPPIGRWLIFPCLRRGGAGLDLGAIGCQRGFIVADCCWIGASHGATCAVEKSSSSSACRPATKCASFQVPIRAWARVACDAVQRGSRTWATVTPARSPAPRAPTLARPVSPVIARTTWVKWIVSGARAVCRGKPWAARCCNRSAGWRHYAPKAHRSASGRHARVSHPRLGNF